MTIADSPVFVASPFKQGNLVLRYGSHDDIGALLSRFRERCFDRKGCYDAAAAAAENQGTVARFIPSFDCR